VLPENIACFYIVQIISCFATSSMTTFQLLSPPPMCTVVIKYISEFAVASSWSVIVLWILVTCNYDAKKWQVCVN